MCPMVRLPLTIEHALLGLLRSGPCTPTNHQLLSSPSRWPDLAPEAEPAVCLAGPPRRGRLHRSTRQAQPKPAGAQGDRLTPEGRDALSAGLPCRSSTARDFGWGFSPAVLPRQATRRRLRPAIERQRRTCRTWLLELHGQSDALRGTRPYDWLVHQFRIGQIRRSSVVARRRRGDLGTPAFLID